MRTLGLPEYERCRLAAVRVTRNHADDTQAVPPLYDDVTGRTAPPAQAGMVT